MLDNVSQATGEPEAGSDTESLLDLLNGIEALGCGDDRAPVIARYQRWIARHADENAATLFAAWFNLGVALANAGDSEGAIEAYRQSLALRRDFYPAAVNLGLLLEAAGQNEAALECWAGTLQPEETRAALTAQRASTDNSATSQLPRAKLLHVCCGAAAPSKLPVVFREPGWQEIRLDIDPAVGPDIVASITDMRAVADASVEAVYSSHDLEHLQAHEVPLALREMCRVLTADGFALITLPDLQEVARHVAEGRLDSELYVSPMGPITPLDILYGHRASIAGGNLLMAHRTGFTAATLGTALLEAGFMTAIVQRLPASFGLTAVAFRTAPHQGRSVRTPVSMLEADQPVTLFARTA
jgi:tetratricopeptide (TPR) repeat protein